MNLCIDIGNTRIKVFQVDFDETKLILVKEEWDENFEELKHLLKTHRFQNGILSTTRTDNQSLIDILSKELENFLFLDHLTPLPIKLLYETPSTLGKDRIAVTVAGKHLFPKNNVFIINMGTCITYDFITFDKKYLGGSIAPGMKMRFKAMNTFTDRLPLVEARELDSFIGTTTEKSLITGVVEGCVAELDGRIDQYNEKFGNIITILTGGDASFFEKKLKNEIFAHPNLLPTGLNEILTYNQSI